MGSGLLVAQVTGRVLGRLQSVPGRCVRGVPGRRWGHCAGTPGHSCVHILFVLGGSPRGPPSDGAQPTNAGRVSSGGGTPGDSDLEVATEKMLATLSGTPRGHCGTL